MSDNETTTALVDKRAILQVLGNLMRDPSLLDQYKFEVSDFGEPFYQLIYGLVFNLYSTGAEKIDTFTIDSACSHFPKQYTIFNAGGGIDYVDSCIKLAEPENFRYYYDRLKKLAYLRYLKDECDLNIRHIYDYTLTDLSAQEAENQKLDNMSIEDIMDKVTNKLITIPQAKYCYNLEVEEFRAGDHLKELKEQWKKTPDYGLPSQSDFLSTISRGMRLSKLFMYSGSTGSGKTRINYGNFAHISVPWYYDEKEKDFIYHEGMDNPALIIQTELEKDENQSLVLAYVSGVNEEHIRTGCYEKGEEARVDKAIEYIESSPLNFAVIHDFNVSEIVNIIKRYKREEGILYYLFDYIQMSSSLIQETAKMSNGMRLREDQVIFLAVDQLKNLCNELGVFLQSGSQLNGTYKNSPVKDETMLRSAKSMADRIDLGVIGLPPTKSEIEAVQEFIPHEVGMKNPNLVQSIYKCRGSKWTRIKVWQYADLGTCRTKDLFVTNNDNEFIDFPSVKIIAGEVIDTKTGEVIGKQKDNPVEQIVNDNSVDSSKVPSEEVFDTLHPAEEQEDTNKTNQQEEKKIIVNYEDW